MFRLTVQVTGCGGLLLPLSGSSLSLFLQYSEDLQKLETHMISTRTKRLADATDLKRNIRSGRVEVVLNVHLGE